MMHEFQVGRLLEPIDYDQARQVLEMSLQLDPNSIATLQLLACVYSGY